MCFCFALFIWRPIIQKVTYDFSLNIWKPCSRFDLGNNLDPGVSRNSFYLILIFNGHIKTAEQRTIIQQYTAIGTLVVDGWAVTFGKARRSLGGLRPRPVPFSCTKCNSPPINRQCTNYILFHVALYLCTLRVNIAK